MSAIDISHLTKAFASGILANDDINLKVNQGECFCLLGPNGAGKSTLINQITTELKPTKGNIRVLGIDVALKPAEAKKMMGIMPQDCGMFEHLTVKQHIKIFSKLKEISGRDCVRNIITSLKLDEHKNKKIGELSFGLKKQVLLATALLGSPPVLILDEPGTGLDPEARRNVWAMLKEKKKEGTTILLTTHQLEEAEYMSDRVGIISSGKIRHLGTISSLSATLKNRFELKMKKVSDQTQITKYFEDIGTAVDFIRMKKIDGFSLATISLENVYFELLGSNRY